MGLLGSSVPSAVIGLDIGTDLIKVAEAKLAKDGIHVTGLGVAPTPQGAIDNGVLVDPEALGAAIKQLLRESGIRTKHVVCSICGQSSVVVRVIEVPKMTKEELKETMKWEVERHVPFSPTEIIMDFAPIERPSARPDAQSMEVLLAVAQDEAVNSHVKALFAADLEPIAIDVPPLAISRPLLNLSNGAKPNTAAIVNIGATSTDVGIYEAGELVFPGPPLLIAGINFTKAISETLGVTIEEAERLKREFAAAEVTTQPAAGYDLGSFGGEEPTSYDTSYTPYDAGFEQQPGEQATEDFSPFDLGSSDAGSQQPTAGISEEEEVFDLGGGDQPIEITPDFDLDDSVQGGTAPESGQTEARADTGNIMPADQSQNISRQVAQAISPVLAELATEIRRTIEYYVTRYQNRPEIIYLCGGTARMPKLDAYLTSELGIEVVVANPLEHIKLDSKKYSPQYLAEVASLFPVSIGLAIREMI